MNRFVFAFVAACTTAHPTPTGTTCADPDPVTGTTTLTWDNFGRDFMTRYCTSCHGQCLHTLGQRNGASLYHDFDYLEGVMRIAKGTTDHIDEQAGWGPKAQNSFMPGGGTGGRCPSVPGGSLDEDCPQPTAEERTNLSQWLACEIERPHPPSDAGVVDCN